jgi:hypothetical protein
MTSVIGVNGNSEISENFFFRRRQSPQEDYAREIEPASMAIGVRSATRRSPPIGV